MQADASEELFKRSRSFPQLSDPDTLSVITEDF